MNKSQFITLIDATGRLSSLMILPDALQVVGVLPHNAEIRPATAQDRAKLIVWLCREDSDELENALQSTTIDGEE